MHWLIDFLPPPPTIKRETLESLEATQHLTPFPTRAVLFFLFPCSLRAFNDIISADASLVLLFFGDTLRLTHPVFPLARITTTLPIVSRDLPFCPVVFVPSFSLPGTRGVCQFSRVFSLPLCDRLGRVLPSSPSPPSCRRWFRFITDRPTWTRMYPRSARFRITCLIAIANDGRCHNRIGSVFKSFWHTMTSDDRR